ncbi:MAG: peptide deformylase, partial [Betaproteobacteria bacterium]
PQEPPIPPTVLINPIIEPLDAQETLGWEGCLSVPGLRGQVPRWTRVRYRGLDEQGQAIDRVVDGFHARVVQHECDHLLGILYPQRMRDFSQFGYTDILFPELAAAKGDDD